MKALLDRPPLELAAALAAEGHRRAWLTVTGSGATAAVRASSPAMRELADQLPQATTALAGHAGIFLESCPDTGALFGAFVHRVHRGQAQGGLRHRTYATLSEFLDDGLRLSQGMSRKSALAGIWWGGGKGLIARTDGDRVHDPADRRRLYRRYGRFVSSLRGCYVTAVDAGTTLADMEHVHSGTRFTTCVAPDVGGSGNPSAMTAAGVVCAIEAALDHIGRGGIAGKTFAMQGGGNVGSCMIEMLAERDAKRVVVAEIDAAQTEWLHDRFAGDAVEVRRAAPGDPAILREACDILVPNGLGAVLDDKTIPGIRAALVCGAANNQLADPARHARALHDRGVLWVPDYLANRMGIVSCADEHAGSLPSDPAIARHFDSEWPGSIEATTRRVLDSACDRNITPLEATEHLADEAIEIPNPMWGDRAERIVRSLFEGGWAHGATTDA